MMFYGLENTQPEVAAVLSELVETRQFPSAVLFAGNQYSGRMYAAMCVAKAFGADIASTVIISDRNHNYRISAALKLYRTAKNRAASEFLKETAGTLLKQYHGALIDSQASSAKKKFSDAGECMDLLNELDRTDEKGAEKLASSLEKAFSSVIDAAKVISVGQVRDIIEWCSTSSLEGKTKIVIIEGLENATESASNALLKTLEEPPEKTHFILISSNSGRIPATVLSRVRKFSFPDFTEAQRKYVLSSLFIDSSKYGSLEDFFIQYSGIDDKLLSESAVSLVRREKVNLPAIIGELEKNQCWDRFFQHILSALSAEFEAGKIAESQATLLCGKITNAVSKGKAFNQMKRLTFDYVFFTVKEVLG